MLFKTSKYLFFLFLFFAFQCCLCQVKPAKHITTVNGLPSNTIKSLYKDSKGSMWIGTSNGLCLYNGKEFKVFTKEDGLLGNEIMAITEDKNKNLWISCYPYGLSKFNGKTFTNYTTKDGLVNNGIRTLQFDEFNNLLIGTEDGLSIFKDNTFWNYKEDIQRGRHKGFQVMEFFLKDKKHYFLSRTHGIYKINTNIKKEFSTEFIGYQNDGFIIIPSKNKNLYSDASGLHEHSNGFPLDSIYTNSKKLSNDIIWDYQLDGDNVFMASWGVDNSSGGLLNYSKGKLKQLNLEYGIESKYVWSLFLDKQTNYLWVGTLDNGIYLINLSNAISYESASSYNTKKLSIIDVNNINGNEWLTTKKELFIEIEGKRIKINENAFVLKFHDYNNNRRIDADNIVYDYFRKHVMPNGFEFKNVKTFNNNIYVNTIIGIYKVSKSAKIEEYYPVIYDKYTITKDGEFLKPQPYSHFYTYPTIKSYKGHKVFETSEINTPVDVTDATIANSKSYFTSRYKGLFVYKKDKPISLNNLGLFHKKRLTLLKSYQDSLLYIASSSSTVYKANTIKDFTVLDSITKDKIVGNNITFIERYNNTLFVGTEKGINIINKDNYRFLDEEEGFTNKVFTSSKIENNKLHLGTTNGLYTIDLKRIISEEFYTNKTSISNLRINYKKADSLLTDQKHIKLNYNQNTVELYLNNNDIYHYSKLISKFSINDGVWNTIENNKILLPNLNNGKHDIKIKVFNQYSGLTVTQNLITLQIKPPYWTMWWFWLIITVLALLFTLLIYYYQITKIKEREALKTQLNKRITETKLEALQSQMNPHFTFNAMSSIQNYIIDNDIDNALMYMGEFSKLIRQTLDNSSESYVALSEELDYLKRYTKLENMRFDNRVEVMFDYQNLDIYEEEIPPMLIQPLIENAFNHAFVKPEEQHILKISFSREKLFLKCVVKDNGTGFDTSNSLTLKSKSKGLKIIKERLSLITNNLSSELFSVISTNSGTTTTIFIPVE